VVIAVAAIPLAEGKILPQVREEVVRRPAAGVGRILHREEIRVAVRALVHHEAVELRFNAIEKQIVDGKLSEMKQKKNQVGNRNVSGRQNANNGQRQESLLEKFFIDQLQDIYYAEQELLKALPKMQKESTTEELQDAFEHHLRQTERHVTRLEKVFKLIGQE